MLPNATGYGWNAAAHRYYNTETGVFVSRQAVRDGLEDMMNLSALRMNEVTTQLVNGGISLADWQTAMMQNIKESHVAASALANGGWAQMNQSDWGFVGQRIREQYDYLRNFSNQIASGEQPLDGRALVRSDMYADASNGTYEAVRTRAFVADGYDEGRRVLESGADHCDDCLDYANEGWLPIDEIPEIGDSQCMTRCRCEITYRKSGESDGATELV